MKQSLDLAQGNPSTPEVCIILAVYNGAHYLPAQLESYVAQTHANWSLLVSDDGSDDGDKMVLDAFRHANPEHVYKYTSGPQKGFAQNFFSLLQQVPMHIPYAALSDQDDVWLPSKLSRAVAHLEALPEGVPGLYCARTQICDAQLQITGLSSLFCRPASFGNALVQSLGGGNTMMLNRAALDLVQGAINEAGDVVAHDWWLYQIVTGCGGQVIYDPKPVLLYRQHDGNLIGSNLSIKARFYRLGALLLGRFKVWNDINVLALSRSQTRFTPQAQEQYKNFKAAREKSHLFGLRHLKHSGVYRQNALGTVALYLACIFKRL